MTLIELLVVIAISTVILGLALKAVQAAREVGRRAQCMTNLREIALGMHSYHDIHGYMPAGTPLADYALTGIFPGHSVFVSLLPHIERQPLYNSINFNHNIYLSANNTVQRSQIDLLLCPSDAGVRDISEFEYGYFDTPDGAFRVAHASYASCSGTWYHFTKDLIYMAELSRQDNGIAYVNSSISLADISDGSSHTIMLSERAHGRLPENLRRGWHWWFDGYFGDTLFWTLYPMNPERFASPDDFSPETNPKITSAGSFHGGGANFAFADGSVRFLKDSIDSWRIDPATGMPEGVRGGPEGPYLLESRVKFGVYQALSTRNGAEVVSDDF